MQQKYFFASKLGVSGCSHVRLFFTSGFDNSFPTCTFCFVFKWRLGHACYFHSLGQDQSIVAQRAEMSVAELYLMSCILASLLVGFHILPAQWHGPLQLRLVKGVCVFRCNLPPALFAEWSESFTCHCVNMGVEWTQGWLWRRKFSCCCCWDSNSQPLNH